MNKHYDSDYLDSTYEKLKGLKKSSYDYFADKNIVIDLGCGNGSDIINLSELYPHAFFIGIDHDSDLIDECLTKSASLSNVTFELSEAQALPCETHSIDAVRAERIFQHLPNTKLVLDEIKRVLKRDGLLQIIETDWTSMNIYSCDEILESNIKNYYVNEKVKSGNVSKRILKELDNVGFHKFDITIVTVLLDDYKYACELIKIDTILGELKNSGVINNTEYCNVMNQFSELFCVTINMIVINSKRK